MRAAPESAEVRAAADSGDRNQRSPCRRGSGQRERRSCRNSRWRTGSRCCRRRPVANESREVGIMCASISRCDVDTSSQLLESHWGAERFCAHCRWLMLSCMSGDLDSDSSLTGLEAEPRFDSKQTRAVCCRKAECFPVTTRAFRSLPTDLCQPKLCTGCLVHNTRASSTDQRVHLCSQGLVRDAYTRRRYS